MTHRYVIPGLNDIKLGFAGWKGSASQEHAAIARLRIGDALRYVADDRGIRLDDDSGITIGRLAKDFQVPPGLQCVAARVHAIFIWRRLDNKPGYREQCRSDVWEVVQPELVFAHEK